MPLISSKTGYEVIISKPNINRIYPEAKKIKRSTTMEGVRFEDGNPHNASGMWVAYTSASRFTAQHVQARVTRP